MCEQGDERRDCAVVVPNLCMEYEATNLARKLALAIAIERHRKCFALVWGELFCSRRVYSLNCKTFSESSEQSRRWVHWIQDIEPIAAPRTHSPRLRRFLYRALVNGEKGKFFNTLFAFEQSFNGNKSLGYYLNKDVTSRPLSKQLQVLTKKLSIWIYILLFWLCI